MRLRWDLNLEILKRCFETNSPWLSHNRLGASLRDYVCILGYCFLYKGEIKISVRTQNDVKLEHIDLLATDVHGCLFKGCYFKFHCENWLKSIPETNQYWTMSINKTTSAFDMIRAHAWLASIDHKSDVLNPVPNRSYAWARGVKCKMFQRSLFYPHQVVPFVFLDSEHVTQQFNYSTLLFYKRTLDLFFLIFHLCFCIDMYIYIKVTSMGCPKVNLLIANCWWSSHDIELNFINEGKLLVTHDTMRVFLKLGCGSAGHFLHYRSGNASSTHVLNNILRR